MTLLASLVILLAACSTPTTPAVSSSPSPSPTPDRIATGGVVRIGQASDIQSLDPWSATDDATITVLRQIYEGLVDLEPGGFKIVPKLAQSWSTSADGRVWTFRLRPGVRFHDGTPLDASAVVFNFERARAFARFDLAGLLASVEAPDPATVVFTLRSPYAPFLATLASGSFGIVNPACIRQGPSWTTPASRCAQGSGPFRIEPGGWQSGDSVTLLRNADYWARDADGRALPYLDGLIFRALRDESTRIAELRSAAVDVALDVGPSSGPLVRSDPNLALRRRPSADVSFIGIGSSARPFDLPEVRRAVALAIDRSAIVQTAYGGDAQEASQLIPPGLLGYDDTVLDFTKYDTAAAKKLLAEAGLPSGFATELRYATTVARALPDPKRIAEAIAADLARIGIAVTVRATDATSLAADIRADVVPLWIGERTAERADPDEFFIDVSSDPVVVELLRRARAESDESKRAELYKQVTKMFGQSIPRVPLFHASPPLAITRKVPGLIPQPIVGESFATVWIGR